MVQASKKDPRRVFTSRKNGGDLGVAPGQNHSGKPLKGLKDRSGQKSGYSYVEKDVRRDALGPTLQKTRKIGGNHLMRLPAHNQKTLQR